MSHSVSIRMIADQMINIAGRGVNIHDIVTIIVNANGVITNAYIRELEAGSFEGWLFEEVK